MTTPEVVCCPDGHYQLTIYGLSPYIVDYPEQALLACIIQGWQRGQRGRQMLSAVFPIKMRQWGLSRMLQFLTPPRMADKLRARYVRTYIHTYYLIILLHSLSYHWLIWIIYRPLSKLRVRSQPPRTRRTNNLGEGAQKKYFTNSDLPAGALTKDHWRRSFIPTFMWWVAWLQDPWNLNDNELLEAMPIIWDEIYAEHCKFMIVLNNTMWFLVSLAISSSGLGSTNSSLRRSNGSVTHGKIISLFAHCWLSTTSSIITVATRQTNFSRPTCWTCSIPSNSCMQKRAQLWVFLGTGNPLPN